MPRFRSNSSSSAMNSPFSSSDISQSNDISFSGRWCESIDVPLSPISMWKQEKPFHESGPSSSNPRLSLSPIGGATGVMKKLLRRRRGNTGNGDEGGSTVVGAGGPSSPTTMPSFVIVGGQGGMATGTTVYDVNPLQSLFSSSCHSPIMIPLSSPTNPTGPTSPRSLKFSTHRDPRAQTIQISGPNPTYTRGRFYLSSENDPLMNGFLTLSVASARKKVNRRSLSADSLWATREQRSSLRLSKRSDGLITAVGHQWKHMSQASLLESKQSNSGLLLGLQDHQQKRPLYIKEVGFEFYSSSVEFLNTHHNRTNTADNWASRNKRKPCIPARRQSESSLLSSILEAKNTPSSIGIEAINKEREEMNDIGLFGLGSCWEDLDPYWSSESYMECEYRSLLSSVDIMLISSISSPTRYYDCPRTRQAVRTYLTAGEREFDDMIEFGFPSSEVIEDKEGKSKDYRFLTLRLTLTPWHARADETMLYGSGDSEGSMPLKDMMNKFLSRTSAMLSSSPPRGLHSASDPKLPSANDRRSPAPDDVSTQAKNQNAQYESARYTTSTWPGLHPISDATDVHSTPSSHAEPSGASSRQRKDGTVPPKNAARNKACGPRKDKGFRIMDPSIVSNASSSVCSMRSGEYLNTEPESCAPSSPAPSPTTLCRHTYPQQQQQPPRKGSLSPLSLPMSTNHHSEKNMPVPPVIPPRRKALSPPIPPNEPEHPQPILDTTSTRSQSTAPFTTTRKAHATQSQSSSHAHFQPQQATVTTSSSPLSSPRTTTPNSTLSASPIQPPSPIADATLPIPVLGTNRNVTSPRRQQQQQQLADTSDLYGGITAMRASRASVRNRAGQSITITMATQQHYGQQYHSQTVYPLRPRRRQDNGSNTVSPLEVHKMYMPRTPYTPPVNSH